MSIGLPHPRSLPCLLLALLTGAILTPGTFAAPGSVTTA